VGGVAEPTEDVAEGAGEARGSLGGALRVGPGRRWNTFPRLRREGPRGEGRGAGYTPAEEGLREGGGAGENSPPPSIPPMHRTAPHPAAERRVSLLGLSLTLFFSGNQFVRSEPNCTTR